MHVLQVIPELQVGGVERGVLDLTKGLIRRGHQATVVSAGGSLVRSLERLGATHHTLPVHRKSPRSMWETVPALSRLIERTQVDLIHARSRVPAWISYVAARRTQRPFLTTCHGFYRPHPISRVMTWGRTVIVPSQVLARYLIDEFGVPPARLRVIPRGVDLEHFRLRTPVPRGQRPWRIGLIGRISPLKGHAVAIRALRELLGQGLLVKLCFIGAAPAMKPHVAQRLRDLAEQLGVSRALEWHGQREEIPDVLSTLDMVIAPSTYPESFGRSVIEAQAMGVPVIASSIGALAEIVEHGTTGLLVRPGDHGELAGALRDVMHDEGLRARLIEHGRTRVEEQFSVTRMVDDTLAVYHETLTKPRIVVWKLSAVGDVILATPSLRAIRRQCPEASISLVVSRSVYEVVARCPYVNEVLVLDGARGATLRGQRQFIRRLRRVGFDVSVDLQNSRQTHLLAWLAGIPVRMGYARRWGKLLTRGVTLPREAMGPVAHQHYLLTHIGWTPDGEALELWPCETDERRVDDLLAGAGRDVTKPLVGMHLGASRRWKTKQWPLAQWATLCDRLSASGMQVVVTGSKAEHALGEALTTLTAFPPMLVIGKTRLMELACLIRRCHAFITTDSAPLHVAAAMGTPTVALFGPTDPARHVPASPDLRVVKKDVFCSPCYSTWCKTVTHACMTRITAEEVFETVEQLRAQNEGEADR